MLFFESSWWTDLSTLSTDNKSATSESGDILISSYDVTGVDGSIPLPSTSLLLFFQGNTVSLSFKSVETPRFFSDGRSLGHIPSTSHSRVVIEDTGDDCWLPESTRNGVQVKLAANHESFGSSAIQDGADNWSCGTMQPFYIVNVYWTWDQTYSVYGQGFEVCFLEYLNAKLMVLLR